VQVAFQVGAWQKNNLYNKMKNEKRECWFRGTTRCCKAYENMMKMIDSFKRTLEMGMVTTKEV